MLLANFITNQMVIQYGAVLSWLLWVPSVLVLLFSRCMPALRDDTYRD